MSKSQLHMYFSFHFRYVSCSFIGKLSQPKDQKEDGPAGRPDWCGGGGAAAGLGHGENSSGALGALSS